MCNHYLNEKNRDKYPGASDDENRDKYRGASDDEKRVACLLDFTANSASDTKLGDDYKVTNLFAMLTSTVVRHLDETQFHPLATFGISLESVFAVIATLISTGWFSSIYANSITRSKKSDNKLKVKNVKKSMYLMLFSIFFATQQVVSYSLTIAKSPDTWQNIEERNGILFAGSLFLELFLKSFPTLGLTVSNQLNFKADTNSSATYLAMALALLGYFFLILSL